jgi:hypothetical protein
VGEVEAVEEFQRFVQNCFHLHSFYFSKIVIGSTILTFWIEESYSLNKLLKWNGIKAKNAKITE